MHIEKLRPSRKNVTVDSDSVVVGYIYLHTLKLLPGHEPFREVTLLIPGSNPGPWTECWYVPGRYCENGGDAALRKGDLKKVRLKR